MSTQTKILIAYLEHLSKLILEGVEADEAAAKREERLMDIGAAFIPHGQAAEAVEPGQRALHHPTMLPQALAGVDALARDAHPDATCGQGPATARDVIGLVRMQLLRPLAPLPSGRLDRWDGIQHRLEGHRVMPVR